MTRRVTQYASGSAAARSAVSWPPQKLAELTRLYVVEGLTCAAIGRQMGLTKNAVIGKITRLKLVRGTDFVPTIHQAGRLRAALLGPSSTLFSRMAALHAKLDAILAAPRPNPAVAYKTTDNATRPFEWTRSA